MKQFASLIILICLYSPTFGQSKTDSLQLIISNKSISLPDRISACKELTIFYIRADSSQAEDYIKKGLKMANELADPEAIIQFHSFNGYMHYRKGNLDNAIKSYEDALAVSRKYDIQDLVGANLFRIGELYEMVGQFELTVSNYKEGLEIFKKLSDNRTVAKILNSLGTAYGKRNDPKALDYLKQSLEIKKTIGDERGATITLSNIGLIQKNMGDYNAALSTFNKALIVFRKFNYKFGIASVSANIANIYMMQGNYEDALTSYHECLEIYTSIKNKMGMGGTMASIGKMYFNKGDFNTSIHYYKKCLSLYQQLGENKDIANANFNIGKNYLYSYAEDSANYYFDEAFTIYKEIDFYKVLNNRLITIGKWYSSQGKLSKALEYTIDALQNAEQRQDTLGIAGTYISFAEIHQTQGNFDQAMEYQQKALAVYQSIAYESGIARVKSAMGETFSAYGKLEESLDNAFEALNIFEQLQDSCEFSYCLLTIGSTYRLLNQPDSALKYLALTNNRASKCLQYSILSRGYTEQGIIYQKKQQDKLAFNVYEKALNYAQVSQNREVIKQSAGYLYPIYYQQGKLDKAFKTLEIFHTSSDSLFNESNTRNLVKQEMEYAFDKEQQQTRADQKQKDLEQQQAIARQNWIIYATIGALIALTIIFIALYKSFNIKKKANSLLKSQKAEIEEKNAILKKQKEELEELDDVKSRFFANISHELRTPLTLISSPLQNLIANQKLNPETSQTMNLMQRNTENLKKLVNNILDLSKLEANAVMPNTEPVAIGSLLRRVSSNYDSLASHLKLDYRCELHDDLVEATLLLDSGKVEKILNNLLSNAIKHTPAEGMVTLSAKRQDDLLKLQVSDDGMGIAAADIPHIFDRYFQGNQPDKQLQGGSGIGLALSRELTNLLGGKLIVSSEEGQGSTFTLYLDYLESKPIKAIDKTETYVEEIINLDHLEVVPVVPEEKEFTVLIVEDHPDMQQFIKSLVDHKYHNILAKNGKAALEILETNQAVDLIISDVMMPEMDGYTFIQRLKESEAYEDIPVIMLTALNAEKDKLKALTIGVDDYLSKPFSPQELMARIHNLLIRHLARQKANTEVLVSSGHEQMTLEESYEENTSFKSEKEWISQVAEVMQSELENPEFHVSDLADQFYLSERQFLRRVRNITGMSPKKYQQEIALNTAREYLENKLYENVTAISFSIGIKNVTRFNQLYEARFGKKPNEYFS